MTIDEAVRAAASAVTWDARVGAIRQIPERFGTATHQSVYAAIAREIYVPNLAPDFAYVHWRDEYELPTISAAYDHAVELTDAFRSVTEADLTRAILQQPSVLQVLRLILGFTAPEFAAATRLVADDDGSVRALGSARIRSIEEGRIPNERDAACCAKVVDRAMQRRLFGESPSADVRLKTEKPDTIQGWHSIREYAASGVPLPVFLHQRHYGGAFRQLLDATSSRRGNVLEEAVEAIFSSAQVPFIRTGSHNQEEIATRFGITIKPAPDFVVFDRSETLRAILECKGANDGGTARDKAARYRALRAETTRLGGVPLFAVLAGLGWTRTADALGPVVRDTDGRVFTAPTLPQILTVQPFPSVVGSVF